jgi:oxygen-independent coproporphyrinogen-3 oxidase
MAPSRGNALGIYISIPFCRSKCTYCNFASGVYPASYHERYIDRLIAEMNASAEWTLQIGAELPHRVDTIYLGGGTPTLLAPAQLTRLFAAIRSQFEVEPDAEITVECAPGQLADETLAALAAAGVNRVSLGVQSFIDREAASTGRLHTRAIAHADIERLRADGISNLNVDLIAGLPGQTFASWQESLGVLIDSGVPHASIYMLEVDEDSRLGREVLSAGIRYHAGLVPSDDAIAQMYSHAIDSLSRAGIAQYEISNFSRASFQSRHNLRYWQRRPYLGFGLDASSMLLGASELILRSTTTDDLNAYLDGAEPVESAWLTRAQQHEEAWFLGLRLNAGVDVAAIEQEFGVALFAPALETVRRLAAENEVLSYDGKTARLTPKGQLLSNNVFQEFLGLVVV